jgi:hypothetical protein
MWARAVVDAQGQLETRKPSRHKYLKIFTIIQFAILHAV